MTVERLHFGSGADSFNAMDATEHFVRYAAAKTLAPGKRVLDIACGEGYGSWLLREWGAEEVVGVDVSEEAIAAANAQFSRQGVRFLLGDACHVCDLLGEERFDLIVCFETIEHVSDPSSLLRSLRLLASPGAVILVSCPNDHVTTAPGESNPFHLRKYTLAEFKSLAESCLGTAQAWLLAANVQGYGLMPEGYPLADQIWTDPAAFLKSEALRAGYVVPSQANIRPAADTVSFYVGVWGSKDVAPLAAVSMQSYAAFIEAWRTLEWLKPQLAEANTHLAETKIQLEGAQEQLTKLHTDYEVARSEAGDLQKEVDRLRRRLLALSDIVATHGAEQSRWNEDQAHVGELQAHVGELQARVGELQFRADKAARLRDEKEAELQRILASRGYRFLHAFYYRLYRIPYLGNLTSSIRGTVGKVLRSIRGR